MDELHVVRSVVRWGRKCSETALGLDILLGLSKVRRCSLNRSFNGRFVPCMYGRAAEIGKKTFRSTHTTVKV